MIDEVPEQMCTFPVVLATVTEQHVKIDQYWLVMSCGLGKKETEFDLGNCAGEKRMSK